MGNKPLRNGEAECIFCGERAMTPDVPCKCASAAAARYAEEKTERAQEKVTRLFRESEGYLEEIDDAGFGALLDIAAQMANGNFRKATVYVGWHNKATFKNGKKGINVTREEHRKREEKDEGEEE